MLALADVNWLSAGLSGGLVLVLALLAGAFSGSEAVLFTLSRVSLERAAASHNPLRKLVARVMSAPKRTLAVILLGNTLVNVLLYANMYVLFREFAGALGPWAPVLSLVITVLLVTILGEAIPKTVGVGLAERLAPFSALLVQVSGYVLGPTARVLDVVLVEPLSRVLLGRSGTEAPAGLSTDELKALLEMSRRRGVIDPVEDSLLREVIDLGTVRVRDVMVPRVEVKTYDLNRPREGLCELIRTTRLKKIPVFEGSTDNIVGLIYAKVLFLEPTRPLRQLLMPVRFVPELISCEQLLHHFRQTRTQVAIVVDEFGGMAGLVTLEDVLESIVGDLYDPEDRPAAPEIVPVSADEYDISGRLGAQYWAQAFGLPRVEERVATVGGLLSARLGRPARLGDSLRLGNIELRVASMHGRRVDRVRVRRLDGAAAEAPAGRPEERS